MSENTLQDEEQLRCNVVVERLINQYSVEELSEINLQLEGFLGLFKKQSA